MLSRPRAGDHQAPHGARRGLRRPAYVIRSGRCGHSPIDFGPIPLVRRFTTLSSRSDLFRKTLAERVLVADGAMGTMLQAADPSMDDFQGHEGCNEILNITCPDGESEASTTPTLPWGSTRSRPRSAPTWPTRRVRRDAVHLHDQRQAVRRHRLRRRQERRSVGQQHRRVRATVIRAEGTA